MKANTIETIISRLVKREPMILPTGCWDWPGRRCSGHYGQCSMSMKLVMVHRVVWEHYNGLVPDGMELDHLCRNRICANPEHLRAVPPLANRGVYQAYTPPPRIDPYPFRVCSHGRGLVTLCADCTREMKDRVNARVREKDALKTQCRKGHPLIDGGRARDGKPKRYCPICLSAGGKNGGRPSHRPKPPRAFCKWGHPWKTGTRGCQACDTKRAAAKRASIRNHKDGQSG